MTWATEQSSLSDGRLLDDWNVRTFEELLAEPVRNGIYKKKEFHGRGQKIVNMGELFAHDFISDQEMKRVELNTKEISKSLLRNGDLLFARRSLVLEGSGKCSLVISPSEDITFESSIIRARLDQGKADPRFYYYLWHSPLGRALMASIATRTAVSGITGSNLIKLKVPHPPLHTQRKIASVLSAYDDLIENNTQRIEILEEMAQAIYREWFVNFRFPGHEKVRMVESPLGLVPEGWEAKPIAHFGQVITGKTPSKKVPEYYGEYMPFIKTPDMHNNMFCTHTSESLSQSGVESQKTKTLPVNSICVSCIGTVGIVSITSQPSQTNQQINSLVLQDKLEREFLYFSLLELKDTIMRYAATGATMANLSKGKFESLRVICPTKELTASFHEMVSPHFEQIKILQLKQANLHRTRDLLLPKLISGEVDVEHLDIEFQNETHE